eukprot:jgi/Bigna1/139647/aug1.51_g14355
MEEEPNSGDIKTNTSETMQRTLRLATFNLLAPCYKQHHGRTSEAFYDDIWTKRQKKCLELLKESQADIICLQEYWFDSPAFRNLYEAKDSEVGLATRYDFYGLKRPRHKEDGVGIFIDRQKMKVNDVRKIIYGYHGLRCALLIHASVREGTISHPSSSSPPSVSSPSSPSPSPSQPPNERQIIVANTHLTYPHSKSDDKLRLRQIVIFCIPIILSPSTPNGAAEELGIFVLGDFNGGDDHVYNLFQKAGFASSYGQQHGGKEAAVTHLTHEGTAVGVDFIWYRTWNLGNGNLHNQGGETDGAAGGINKNESKKVESKMTITVNKSFALPKKDSTEV